MTTDTVNQRTLITWADGLTYGATPGSSQAVYALRQRAALFGYNAVNPLMLAKKTQEELENLNLIQSAGSGTLEWNFSEPGGPGSGVVDLDAVYAKVTSGGYLALILPDGSGSGSPAGTVTVGQIASVTTVSRSDYGVSAKITRATLWVDPGLAYYTATRNTSVLVQSEQLPVAEQPLDHPLYGSVVDLEVIRTDLAGVTAIAITGKSQSITLNADATSVYFTPDDPNAAHISLAAGATLTVLRPPDFLHPDGSVPPWKQATQALTLSVADTNGRSGTVTAALSDFTLGPAAASAPVVQEFALISGTSVHASPFPHTRIQLQTPLVNCYDRTATSINANVGPATAGSSVTEVMGSGSASATNQQFTLRQSPLTYVQTPTSTGR